MRRLRNQFFYTEITFGILTLIFGVLFQFLDEWSTGNYFVGIIAPVNASIWEHLKTVFFPIFLLSAFEYFYIGRYFTGFITARTSGCFAAICFTIIFYYTYSGIIGAAYIWLDIVSFFVSVILCYGITWHITITKRAGNSRTNLASICFLLLMCYLFLRFTTYPPGIGLFQGRGSNTTVSTQFPMTQAH